MAYRQSGPGLKMNDDAINDAENRQAMWPSGGDKIAPGLYVVATPIGNMRDISLRALDVLAAADLVLCEDTRVSQKLFSRFGLKPTCLAYHEHNAEKMRPRILARLEKGEIVALISDAGTPLISDPGMPLVRAARAAAHHVSGLPGPSAPIMALSIAGLPTDRFCFAGFLPPKKNARHKALADLLAAASDRLTGTVILFESAKRLCALLADIDALAPQAEIVVARELTKKFEQVTSGTARELHERFTATPARGEVTLLIAAPPKAAPAEKQLDSMLADVMATMSRRDAVRHIADETGLARKHIYARALALEPLDEPNNKKDKSHHAQQEEAASDRPVGETKGR